MSNEYLKFKISEPHTTDKTLGVTMLFGGPLALDTLNLIIRVITSFVEKHKDCGKDMLVNAYAIEIDTQAFHSLITTFGNLWQTASKGKGIRFSIHTIVDYPPLQKTST